MPFGLGRGLEAAGAEVASINARPPGAARFQRLARRDWTWEATTPAYAAVSGRWADREIRRQAPIHGVIAIGSGYLLKGPAPIATYDDLTVAQGTRQPFSPVHDVPPKQVARWIERQRRIYEGATACCAASHWAATSIAEDYSIDPAKIHVVGFGRNFEPLHRERSWTIPRFIFIGVEWERKHGPAVLDAFAAVRETHPDATLDLIGGHPEVDRPGVTGHGRLSLRSPEQRDRLHDLLGRATCLVLPSDFEAFGISYVDAGAAGVPSIGTTEGGAADAVGPGGFLVPPRDPQALLAAMLAFCDPELARERGRLAEAHSALFTWRAAAERILRCLRPPGVDITGLADFVDPSLRAQIHVPS
ncbi:MAG TPA: glycosyltransferase family 4 protein [Solirubrobacterales bacterium]